MPITATIRAAAIASGETVLTPMGRISRGFALGPQFEAAMDDLIAGPVPVAADEPAQPVREMATITGGES